MHFLFRFDPEDSKILFFVLERLDLQYRYIISWIDYHDMPPEQEKELIRKAIESITNICGEPPKGWYYGRLSPQSRALVWEVYKELGLPLLWNSDSHEDDVPYWVDVPGEKSSEKPEGLLMIPYSYGRWQRERCCCQRDRIGS